MADPLNPPINYPGGKESIWSLEEGIKKGGHRNFLDWIDGPRDINTNPNAIDWEARFRDGKIDKATGQVLVQAEDGYNSRSQPELQLAYEKFRRGKIASALSMLNAELQENDRPILEIPDNKPANQIGRAKIIATAKGLDKIIEARDILSSTPGGNAALLTLGDTPTVSQLLGAKATLDATSAEPLKNLQLQKLRSSLDTDLSTRTLNRDTLNLNSIIAQNTQAMNEWKIRDAAAARDFEQTEATRRAQYDSDNSNANRALQLQLAQMASGERRDDREYSRSRDSRQDRQLMMMQLVKGLQGIGRVFE